MSLYSLLLVSVYLAITVCGRTTTAATFFTQEFGLRYDRWNINIKLPLKFLNSSTPFIQENLPGFIVDKVWVNFTVSYKLEGPQERLAYSYSFYPADASRTNFKLQPWGIFTLTNWYNGRGAPDGTKYHNVAQQYQDTFAQDKREPKVYLFLNKTTIMDPSNGWLNSDEELEFNHRVGYLGADQISVNEVVLSK